MRAVPRLAIIASTIALSALSCRSGASDLPAFCSEVAEVRESDPFTATVMEPRDMRIAFVALADGATELAAVAPDVVAAQAERYRGAVDDLVQILAPADYDPSRLDRLAYADAADRYVLAADALDNAADAACEPLTTR